MKELIVETPLNPYKITINSDFCNLSLCFLENKLDGRDVLIVTDSNVLDLYADLILGKIQSVCKSVNIYAIKAGEDSKNLAEISKCYEFCMAKKLGRGGVIVALGGGVVGDFAGFVAATYLRGIAFVQVPTTLLSQVDSSVGGKVGVDFMGNKNIIGAFYQPKFVYINTNTLLTLSPPQFASGMGEAIKYGLIQSADYFDFIVNNKENIKQLDEKNLETLIFEACKMKADVVSKDEKELGLREILNFGHTFGHAIETLSNFGYSHGQCVAFGMVAALKMSTGVSVEQFERVKMVLEYFNLQTKFSSGAFENLTIDNIYEQMFLDKKTKQGQMTLVLLEKFGRAKISTINAEAEVKDAIDSIKG